MTMVFLSLLTPLILIALCMALMALQDKYKKTPMDELQEVFTRRVTRGDVWANARKEIEQLKLEIESKADRENIQVLRKAEFDQLIEEFPDMNKSDHPYICSKPPKKADVLQRMMEINSQLDAEARKNNVVDFSKGKV